MDDTELRAQFDGLRARFSEIEGRLDHIDESLYRLTQFVLSLDPTQRFGVTIDVNGRLLSELPAH